MSVAIRAEHLSKKYIIGHTRQERYTTLRETMMTGVREFGSKFRNMFTDNSGSLRTPSTEEFWALNDLSFEIQHGDSVGIIGRNGAGKSTLLKVLSRITEPTTGRVELNGRVASLLEVGTGFHPELTGRENIFLNGAILGMSRTDIMRKFDEIVDFSEVEKFLDTPVKRYSSGMYVRLAFAVAAHLEPEILVVDEVLAVGDAQFQKKCLGKMEGVTKEGRTVLFVSHNMSAIESLCKNAMLLDRGKISHFGETVGAIETYNQAYKFNVGSAIADSLKYVHPDFMINLIEVNNSTSRTVTINESVKYLNFKIEGELKYRKTFNFEAWILDYRNNILMFYSPGHLTGINRTYDVGAFVMEEKIRLPSRLSKGDFFITFSLSMPNIETYVNGENTIHLISEGIKAPSGVEFAYQRNGLIILD
jgi:ABC-type polysaccharide/polyol phosphate transport system ATPase subunit